MFSHFSTLAYLSSPKQRWSLQRGCELLIILVPSVPQAPAAGSQGEQDGTGNWRGMLKKGEDAPGSGPGSPLKGAVNLLDVVSCRRSSL